MIITELMGSILLLLNCKKYREPVLEYVVPVWEITGTFWAFWVVTADFAYPPILYNVKNVAAFIALYEIAVARKVKEPSSIRFLMQRLKNKKTLIKLSEIIFIEVFHQH